MAKKKSKSKSSKQSAATMAPPYNNDHVEDVIAAALSKAPPSVRMKVCRLCEMKDGPFLNIFDAEKVTARKIEELMPFGIAENDDLPHKICFRCSAKVEELHEFIQKCIKTQESLRSAMGKEGPLTMKSRERVCWEQHLHKTKLSNDDICDVLIKRAMEGIPLNAPLEEINEEKPPEKLAARKSNVETLVLPNSSGSESDEDGDADINLKQVKLSIAKSDAETTISRTSRSSKSCELLDGSEPITKTYSRKSQNKTPAVHNKPPETQKSNTSPKVVQNKIEPVIEKPKEIPPQPTPAPPPPPPPAPKTAKPATPFNIMDHVSTIKVNGVGILYQCKLCVRNFLKKDMVMNHGCAKNSAPPKETNPANAALPEPPKAPTVKYIKITKDAKKPVASLVDKTVDRLNPPPAPLAPPAPPAPTVPPKPTEPEVKPRPKIGPASRTRPKPDPKEIPIQTTPPNLTPEVPKTPAPANPLVSFPTAPSLNSRYKLVPGPNNTFQLVEESQEKVENQEKLVNKPLPAPNKGSKRKTDTSSNKPNNSKLKHKNLEKSSSPEVIDLDDNESQKPEPYPVGLFQPVPHHSSVYPPSHPPVPFTTPAMKKQSYTIVQTGNPSKLLISTKPQPVTEEPPKKKSKKKTEVTDNGPLEDTTPPKDPGFFTFVSLDTLQPSYVLPTDNIIQESQITTSTPGSKPFPAVDKEKDKYPCNMCGESFSREKKLLSHIQSHYNQMDEEDEKRVGKPGPKRKTRKP